MAEQQIVPTVIVHGGAGYVSSREKAGPDEYYQGIKMAVKAGYKALCNGSGSALDAVEAAVCVMEDLPTFNAGKGSNLTIDGDIEMDGFIMEGAELRTGAVTCVQNIQNPVKLARMVMEKTEHILLAGEGAKKFAKEMGLPEVSTQSLITEKRRQMLETEKTYVCAVNKEYKKDTSLTLDSHDTVGAVAIDVKGHIACATSTGGITAQMQGRVGDSPLVGCGGYCDNEFGGVSTTGHGEAIARVTLARNIVFYMEQGLSAQAAAEKALHYMEDKVHSDGGVIVIDKHGNVGKYWTTEGMPWAYMKNGELHYGLFKDDEFVD